MMAARAKAGIAVDERLLESEDTLGADEKRKRIQGRHGGAANTHAHMLEKFTAIKKPEHVLRFAERFGVLNLCEHGLPGSHNWPATTYGCYPVGWETGVCREPINLWLDYAAQFRAVLRLIMDVLQGQAGADDDWDRATAGYLSDGDELGLAFIEDARATNAGRRSLLAGIINRLLALGAVRPNIMWARDEGGSSFQLSGSTFGLMALQLALISSGSHRLASCFGCKELYVRTWRLPRLGQHGYCKTCSTTEANRQRQSSWRAKPENREREQQLQRERRAREQQEQAANKQQEVKDDEARK